VKKIVSFLLALSSALAMADDLRVLTFNIRFDNPKDGPDQWENRREAVAKVIADTADVAGLQEVKPQQRAWLIEHLPEFGFIGVGREPEDKDESVPVIFRKDRFEVLASGTFWLSSQPETPGSASFGNKLPRICTWAKLRDRKAGAGKDGTLWFYNVHLDHQSPPARERGLALVLDRMAARDDNGPALLVGDFNSTTENTPLKAALAREKPALVTNFQSMKEPAEGTFHGFTGKPNGMAIDYILTEKDRWTVKSSEVLKTTYVNADGTRRQVSDHFPVRAVVTAK
jgi:endonuclease/exonuclease/phosphatase family metal-dependent hydrolase